MHNFREENQNEESLRKVANRMHAGNADMRKR